MDKVEGVPPAIAISTRPTPWQPAPTVGIDDGLNDHLKLLFARAGQLFDQ